MQLLGHQIEGEGEWLAGMVRGGGEGERTDNGERGSWVLCGKQHGHYNNNVRKYTWTSPDGRTRNQIDLIAVNGTFKRSVWDARAFRGADVRSDHNLVAGNIRLTLSRVVKKQGAAIARKYELSKLKVPEIKHKFVLELKNRFSSLTESEMNEMGYDDIQNAERVEQN